MYAQMGQMEKALEYSQRSYRNFRENSHNVEVLSQLLAQAGRESEALELQQEALKLRQLEAAKRDALMKKTSR